MHVQEPGQEESGNISLSTLFQHHKSFFKHPEHLGVIINTDGISMFKSSRITIWPIYLQLANLPPLLRFRRDNIVTCGLWVGQTKPNMDTLLAPVLQKIDQLNALGMPFQTPQGAEVVVRILLLFGVFDLPAKAQVLSMIQFNGSYGCATCLHPGVWHGAQVYPPGKSYPLRTEEGIYKAFREGHQSGKIIEGIKGISPLKSYVNLVDGVPSDYMHCVLEGVVKWLLKAWTGQKFHDKPFSIRRFLDVLDQSLLKQRPPHELTRPPRSIKLHLSYWKASEFRSWLLFYSLPLLLHILPPLYFHHFSLLVCSIHLLLQTRASVVQTHAAEEMLQDFCSFLPELYGVSSCTMNAHCLTHLPYFVRKWGPLWTHSAFSFESMNGTLTNMVHSTKKIAEQLSFSLDIKVSLQEIYSHLEAKDTQKLLDYLQYHTRSRSQKMLKLQCGYALSTVAEQELTPVEFDAAKTLNFLVSDTKMQIFHKLLFDGSIFHSTTADEGTKRDSSFCCYRDVSTDNECFGEIQKFGECSILGTIAFIKKIEKTQSNILKKSGKPCRQILETHAEISIISQIIIEVHLDHMHDASARGGILCIPIPSLVSNCILVKPTANINIQSRELYIVKLPNNYEHQ